MLFSWHYSIQIFHPESNDSPPFGSFFFQQAFYILDSTHLALLLYDKYMVLVLYVVLLDDKYMVLVLLDVMLLDDRYMVLLLYVVLLNNKYLVLLLYVASKDLLLLSKDLLLLSVLIQICKKNPKNTYKSDSCFYHKL